MASLNYEITTWIEVLFSLNEVKKEKARFTGIDLVDSLINFFAANTTKDYPRIFPILESFLHEVAKTGFFSYLYLRSQYQLARKIRKLLEVPDFV